MYYLVFLHITFFVQFLPSTGIYFGDQSVINNVAGFFLEQLTEKFPSEITIANLTKSYLFGVAKFKAFHGTLADVHRIERKGDVIVNSDDIDMNVTLPFFFKELRVVYREYTASLMGLTSCGSLEATAKDHLFSISAKITEGSRCFISICDFKVNKLSDFDVKIFPREDCPLLSQEASSKLATNIANYLQEKIRDEVEQGIHMALLNLIPSGRFICVFNDKPVKIF